MIKQCVYFSRYIFDSENGLARQNLSFEEPPDADHRARSNSYSQVLKEDIYTPPTPSSQRKHNANKRPPIPGVNGLSDKGGSSKVVVTGFVKDENHNHHTVKYLDNASSANLTGFSRTPHYVNRPTYHVTTIQRSHDPRLPYNKSYAHHRSLDHLASLGDYEGLNHHRSHSQSDYLDPLISSSLYGSQPRNINLGHKPPPGNRPVGQGHSNTHHYSTANRGPGQGSLPRKLHWSLSAARRRTWSPPTFRQVAGVGSSLAAMRSYHSNDQLDMDYEENYYEDLDAITGPPRLAPISGKFDNKVRFVHFARKRLAVSCKNGY